MHALAVPSKTSSFLLLQDQSGFIISKNKKKNLLVGYSGALSSVFSACCCGIRCFFLKSLWAQNIKAQVLNKDFIGRIKLILAPTNVSGNKCMPGLRESDGSWASKMAQQVEVLAAKSENQSSIPRVYTVGERADYLKLPSESHLSAI